MVLHAMDPGGSGNITPVMGYFNRNERKEWQLFPAANLSQIADRFPAIKKLYLHNSDFAGVTLIDLLSGLGGHDLPKLQCAETRSCWFESTGNGKFVMHPLPVEAQFAPVNAIVATDVDKDGKKDLLLAGNEYQAEPMTGRYDASYGCFLKGDGKGKFNAVPSSVSGFIIDGDVMDIKVMQTERKEKLVLIAVNDGCIKAFKVN